MLTSSNLLWAALAIGAVTGMRSMLAPTLVSRALSERDDLHGAGEAARLLTSDSAQTFLPVLAAGEIAGDKMPFAPDRTIVPSMMFRAVSGGVSAAALAGVRREPVLLPALLGATAALLASKIGLSLRKTLSAAFAAQRRTWHRRRSPGPESGPKRAAPGAGREPTPALRCERVGWASAHQRGCACGGGLKPTLRAERDAAWKGDNFVRPVLTLPGESRQLGRWITQMRSRHSPDSRVPTPGATSGVLAPWPLLPAPVGAVVAVVGG